MYVFYVCMYVCMLYVCMYMYVCMYIYVGLCNMYVYAYTCAHSELYSLCIRIRMAICIGPSCIYTQCAWT